MTVLRSALFNLAFFGWTALVAVIGAPALALPRPVAIRVQALWIRGAMVLLRRIAGIAVEIRGQAPRGAALIAVKHQSAWDTLIWPLIVRNPAYVLKKELALIPFFGWFTQKLRNIPVDREGGAPALKALVKGAQEAVRAGRPVIIFPEGTRTAPGTTRPYQPGVAALYRRLGLDVIPVAVNSGLFWPRRGFLKRRGTIVLEFLTPIPPGLERGDFLAQLEVRIETATEALAAESRGG